MNLPQPDSGPDSNINSPYCGSWYQAGETGLALCPQNVPQELVLKQQQNSFNGINKFLRVKI
jgi:hypothetical protein